MNAHFHRISIYLVLLAVTGALWPGAASAQVFNDVPAPWKLDHREAKAFEQLDPRTARSLYRSLYANLPSSFTVAYDYARFLARQKDYPEAQEALDRAIDLFEMNNKGDVTVYNTKGFLLAMDGRHEEAIEFFLKQEDHPHFSQLPKESQMKLFNNMGFSFLKLDRYEEARKYFERAQALGSTLAKKNLTVVDSIVTALRSGDENLPGIFAPSIGSASSQPAAEAKAPALAQKLGIDRQELYIFRNEFGKFVITHGANLSYPRAERLVEDARAKGIWDAWIASTAEWRAILSPVTSTESATE